MKDAARQWLWARRLHMLPLSWLTLSRGQRWLLVALSYALGIIGLWLFFPPTHNGATMFLPIICACWLFRYRGLVVSMLLNGVAFQLVYQFAARGTLPDSVFVVGGSIGFATSLLTGLIVCWLRTAVDALYAARQQVMEAERARAQIELRERQAMLAYEQERKMAALKEQFLLNVSHELRTPLTVLTGTLDLLISYRDDLDAETLTRILLHARKSQEELVTLVDQVLDTTRIVSEIPTTQPESLYMHALLLEILETLPPADLAAYTLRLQVDEQLQVWADPQLLRQVLRNLFSNIFKYVPINTEIRVEATQTDPSSPVRLVVQDAGPGIPSDEQALLFEKFVRLKRDLAGSVRGTGLGLYLCKSFVEAMGGRIWIESSGIAGEGTRFCLTLPASPLTPAANGEDKGPGEANL